MHDTPPPPPETNIPSDPVPSPRARTCGPALGIALFHAVIVALALAFMLHGQNRTLADDKAKMDKTSTELDQAKDDLVREKAATANEKAQLDSAKAAQTDLQNQLAKAQSMGSDLQNQLNQSQNEVKSQQDLAQTRTSDLQARLNLANVASTAVRKELDQEKRQLADLQAQLDKATAKISSLEAPPAKQGPLPVAASFEKSFFGGSFTMHLKNTGATPLKVDIDITGSPKAASRSATIAPGATYTVEDVADGSSIVLAGAGFEPVTVKAH